MITYKPSDFWDEWEKVTRLLHSARIAIQTEVEKWNGLSPEQRKEKKVVLNKNNGRQYSLSIQEHIDILLDEGLFSAMILQYSCGAIEDHGRTRLTDLVNSGKVTLNSLQPHKHHKNSHKSSNEVITDYIKRVQIEVWGDVIINAYGLSWSYIEGNKRGITEVFTIRNAIAHGESTINQTMINRANEAGGTCAWSIGDPVMINFDFLQEYRARLKSFARIINGD
jgi:hypothetical protein